jgi:hypothetical protein
MYTVLVGYDNLTEVYQVSEYDDNVKDAIECISTYGGDCIELVFKGDAIETLYEESSIFDMIKNFDDSEFFEAYYEEDDKDRIEGYKELLIKVAIR